MALVRHIVETVADLAPSRVLEVGAGRRFDVAKSIKARLPDATVVVTDRDDPDPPPPLFGGALDLLDPGALDGGADVVVAVRLPPELWEAAARVADRAGADLVLCPLPEEVPPDGLEQVRPGVFVRRPRTAP